MDPPKGLVYQSELPVVRDAIQCRNGRWFLVQLRMAPMKVLAEMDTKDKVLIIARKTAELPLWEEHYEGMTLVDCVPPKGVYRDPQTCFLVTDGTPRPTKAPPEPESHVRLKVMPERAPETPRSANWPEEKPSDWKIVLKKLVNKL